MSRAGKIAIVVLASAATSLLLSISPRARGSEDLAAAAVDGTTAREAHAATDANAARARTYVAPPLDSIVAGTLLVRGRGDRAMPSGARLASTMADGTESWELDGLDAGGTRALRDALATDAPPGLEIELDLWRSAQLAPSDEGYKNQWPLALMKVNDAWNVTTGDPDLVVAVVDTGVVDHPDLRARLVRGYDFVTDLVNAGDGDGRDPDPADVGDESEESSGFHGTHISGIIGAATDNGIGMAGTDWRCRVQPVRVLGVSRHRGKDSDIADGIRWASGLNVPGVPINDTPAKVINLSFGGPGFSRVLQDAVLAALARGSVLVASAGNDHDQASQNVPGALEGVLSVAAAGPDGALAPYSNYGPRVDLVAPGGSYFIDAPVGHDTPGAVWSTSFVRASNQPVFAYAAGTSQAAAYASGVAALVRAAAPTLRPEVVTAVMRRATVIPKGGCEAGCGGGLIDASLAVAYARDIAVSTCGAIGCGNHRLDHAPLRPEEGCSIARAGGDRASGAPWLFSIAALSIAIAARRRARAVTRIAIAAMLASCSSGDGVREGQSAPPLTVTIKDPIPTLRDGELTIAVGADGRWLVADVSPTTSLEQVELHALAAGDSFARVAHAPFRFFLPSWAPGAEGRRQLCITATDAAGTQGEACFTAVR